MADPLLQEQYATLDQQRETSTLGMWVFLATEVMFFGGLFAAFSIYHHLYPEAFAAASRHCDFWLGAGNTAVLLVSSLFMARGVHAAKAGDRKALIRCLLITLFLGVIFLTLKGAEYAHHIQDHLLPGPGFRFEPPSQSNGAELFFFLYFVMTGLHAVHMTIGIAVLAVLTVCVRRGRFLAEDSAPIEVSGLYWHFVDVMWIFLFPLFYLMGGH